MKALQQQKILIFRIGFLGDTLISIPAIWVVKERFPSADLYLLSERLVNDKRVVGREIFEGSGIFKAYIGYPVDSRWIGKALLPFRFLMLFFRLKRENFSHLIYLAPSQRNHYQITRDKLFFKFAGIKNLIGMQGFQQLPVKVEGKPLKTVGHEADLLLERLKASGLETPAKFTGKMDLNFGENEERQLNLIIGKYNEETTPPWIGIGPGGKKQVSIWPAERYIEIGKKLSEKYHVWPVVFGGKEDRELGEKLVKQWGCGYNFAGLLPVRLTALAIKRCRLFLGNDTGTIHLAAAVKAPCVGVYSSHSYPGRWYPYGAGHKVFRTQIECEGCDLFECIERKKECILSIGVEEVIRACEEILERQNKPVANG